MKSIWDCGHTDDVVFLADYEVNPLGVKNDAAIAAVVDKWIALAAEHSETLIVGCNTLSIRYHQLLRCSLSDSGLTHIVSMVDCFKAMVEAEADRLADAKVLIIGTKFTASQPLYPAILKASVPGVQVESIGATMLERQIARFEPREKGENSILADGFGAALEKTQIAILACTCFPMVKDELESMYPDVIFLDPGAYCPEFLRQNAAGPKQEIAIKVTGDIVTTTRVNEFATAYLGEATVVRSL